MFWSRELCLALLGTEPFFICLYMFAISALLSSRHLLKEYACIVTLKCRCNNICNSLMSVKEI
jgi:hypothetical protein